MNIILEFGYSADLKGYCASPPRFDNITAQCVHDGHQEYAAAVTEACIVAAKNAIAEVARRQGKALKGPDTVPENIGEALDRMGVKTQETGFSGGCHVGSTTK